MKTKLITLLAMVFAVSTAAAQNTSTTTVSPEVIKSNSGLRVTLVKSNLKGRAQVNFPDVSFDESVDLDNAMGVAVGYVSLPVQQLGWTANLALVETKMDDVTANFVRTDGNAAYAFNQYVSLKSGLNAIKFISGNGLKDLNPKMGFQAGVGVQITNNLGFDIGYTEMHTAGNSSDSISGNYIESRSYNIKLSGLEIGLNGTF